MVKSEVSTTPKRNKSRKSSRRKQPKAPKLTFDEQIDMLPEFPSP